MRKHYVKSHNGVEIDVYDICELYGIKEPAIYQAIKKLLRFGSARKGKVEDVKGAKLAIERWLEINERNKNKNK